MTARAMVLIASFAAALGYSDASSAQDEARPDEDTGCHPSYEGACVPFASDVDCIGGSGNGPAYVGRVIVVGPDVYGLDRDGDGIGCDQ